jgi:putative spermidine/putrescine transport system substrate-binding protein
MSGASGPTKRWSSTAFGGEYQELFEKNVIEPFEKKFGVKVIHDATGTSSQDYAKIRASKGRPASTSPRR